VFINFQLTKIPGGVYMKLNFSETGNKLKSSIIRELLKDAMNEGVISFGGGVPDPETFPKEKLAEIAKDVVLNEYKRSLQYGPTEGNPLFRKTFLEFLEKTEGISGLNEDNILITVGSQSALHLLSTVFLDKQSIYFVSKPVYLGAASAFVMNSERYEYLVLHKDGIDVDDLSKRLTKLDKKGEIENVKFIYVVPNFHNPAGVTLSLEKRKAIIELAEKYDIPIIEDDPYGELRYEGERLPSLFKLAGKDRVLMLRTFSKILSPGMRLGIVVGNKELVRKMVMAKQAADLCTPSLTQIIAARFLQKYNLNELLKPTIKLYKEKKDLMLKELEKAFKDMNGVTWTEPEGGLFIWLTLPEGYDTLEMMDIAKEIGVLFIPGSSFSLDGSCANSMRLSFCLPPEKDIVEGVRRLKEAVVKYGKNKNLL
jgi:DNA-binding transcriptional MocR family regulator